MFWLRRRPVPRRLLAVRGPVRPRPPRLSRWLPTLAPSLPYHSCESHSILLRPREPTLSIGCAVLPALTPSPMVCSHSFGSIRWRHYLLSPAALCVEDRSEASRANRLRPTILRQPRSLARRAGQQVTTGAWPALGNPASLQPSSPSVRSVPRLTACHAFAPSPLQLLLVGPRRGLAKGTGREIHAPPPLHRPRRGSLSSSGQVSVLLRAFVSSRRHCPLALRDCLDFVLACTGLAFVQHVSMALVEAERHAPSRRQQATGSRGGNMLPVPPGEGRGAA